MFEMQWSIINKRTDNTNTTVRGGVCESLLRQYGLQKRRTQSSTFAPALLLRGIKVAGLGVRFSVPRVEVRGFTGCNLCPRPFFGLSPICGRLRNVRHSNPLTRKYSQ